MMKYCNFPLFVTSISTSVNDFLHFQECLTISPMEGKRYNSICQEVDGILPQITYLCVCIYGV